jgi:histidine ammonia-lyase
MERSATTPGAAGPGTVRLTGGGLAAEDIGRVARGAILELAPEVLERVEASRAVVERALERDVPVYGLNTGLGSRRDRRVPPEDLARYQEQMVWDHAGGVGDPLPDEDVRAIMAARIAGIARGGSGAHPDALDTLVRMLNAGVHPVVPSVGSVGASDLMHMAAIAMVVTGRGEARLDGRTMAAGEALEAAGIAPYRLRPKDGIALVNANGASVGLGALALLDAGRAVGLADVAGALTLEAYGGNPGPFDEEAARAKPLPGVTVVAAHLRELLAGGELTDEGRARPLQDPLSFRVMPQVHGALRDQVDATRAAVEAELNAAADSPLVSIERDRLLSNGNFHPMGLALAFEALRIALAHAGMLSERRMNKLMLPLYGEASFEFGSPAPERYSVQGYAIYSAAALVSELKQLAAPVTLNAPPLDLDVEDHATLAPQAVMLSRHALELLELVLAIEVLVATSVLQARPAPPRLGNGTRPVYDAVLATVEPLARSASSATVVETFRRRLLELV